MRRKSASMLLLAGFLGVGSLLVTTPAFAAGPERVLYNFCSAPNCTDGANSWAALIFDSAGNLYGATAAGGSGQYCYLGCGTVFALTPAANGQWTETVLYSFCSLPDCADGAAPYDALIFDAAGNLYGTTAAGGSEQCVNNGVAGCGTIFELTPTVNGQWTETVLYNLCSAAKCADGAYPYAGLIFDSAGNLYGTTADVPTAGQGVPITWLAGRSSNSSPAQTASGRTGCCTLSAERMGPSLSLAISF